MMLSCCMKLSIRLIGVLIFTNSTKKETRAYYLYNLTQGKATYNDFVQELKSAVNRSTQNFEEEVFIETLKELQTNN